MSTVAIHLDRLLEPLAVSFSPELRSSLPSARRTLPGMSPDHRPERLLARGTILAETYRLESLLGQGGMGTVYLASDLAGC